MEEKKKNMLLKVVIVVCGLIVCFLIYDFTPIMKVPLGNAVFGKNQCTLEIQKSNGNNADIKNVIPVFDFDDKHSGFGGDAISTWKCKLCLRIKKHPNTAVPMLCNLCAKLTNRCEDCADLLGVK